MSPHENGRKSRTFQFWSFLLEYAKTRTELFVGQMPTTAGGFGTGFGRTGLKIGFLTRMYDSTVEVEIDGSDLEGNLETYVHLQRFAVDIDSAFGDQLEWNQVLDRRTCHIRCMAQGGWKSPMEEWPVIHKNMVDKVIRLEAAVRPYIASIPV